MFKPRGKVESMRMKITKNEGKTYSIEYNCNLKAGSQAGEKGHSKCMTNRIVLLYSVIIVISVSNIYVPLTHIHNNKKVNKMHPHLDSTTQIHTFPVRNAH